MSRRAKIFLATSIAATTFTVWGVHHLQEREYQSTYEGVIKDEERVRAKALLRQQSSTNPLIQATPSSPSLTSSPAPTTASNDLSNSGIAPPTKTIFERQLEYDRNLKLQEELGREQGLKKSEEERKRLEEERRRMK